MSESRNRLSELKREYDEHNYFISFEEYCYKSGVVDGFNECRNNGYEVAFANGMKKGRADVFDELENKSFCDFTICKDCAMWGQHDEFGNEEVCILERLKLKEQK